MPSSYPIPSIAALALSLYASDRKVENLPVLREFFPCEEVRLSPVTPAQQQAAFYRSYTHNEGI